MNEEWRTIYEEYVDDVYRFLVYFTGHPTEAEDIRQETFLRAFRGWQRFDNRSSVKTWLFSIAKNLAVDRARKSKRQQLLQRCLKQQPPAAPLLPEEWTHLSERNALLYTAIQQLPLTYRLVVILRGIQEHSPKEAAEILHWDVSKVNLTYHRALKALRKTLQKEDVFHELAAN